MEGADAKDRESTPALASVTPVCVLHSYDPVLLIFPQWFIRYQRFSNAVLVVLALVSVVYLPVLRDIRTGGFQTLLRLIAPAARSILSRVDGDVTTPLPQDIQSNGTTEV